MTTWRNRSSVQKGFPACEKLNNPGLPAVNLTALETNGLTSLKFENGDYH